MITVGSAFRLGARAAESISQELRAGEALVSFMCNIRNVTGPTRMTVLLSTKLVTCEEVAGGRHVLTYEGSGRDDLRPIREAFWYCAYYARHPHFCAIVGSDTLHSKLTILCEQQRRDIQHEASLFVSVDDVDLSKLWRRALLFAARVKDARDIERAMDLSADLFETTIEMIVDDTGRSLPFSELLDFAEMSAPA